MGPAMSQEMRAYYDRRAQEYDDWWTGAGQFAARRRPGWAAEVETLTEAMSRLSPARTLDVACGTGYLTGRLPGEVVAIDQSPRMVAVAGARLAGVSVQLGEAVPLPFADGSFARVFTSHFYGHLTARERARFLAEARRVGSELVVVDSALRPGHSAEEWQQRLLDDGSTHRVFKRYFDPAELASELGGGEILHAGRWFVMVRAASGRPGPAA